MLKPLIPALVVAPMDGITDAPMRTLLGEFGAFTYAVSEFVRVSSVPLNARAFRRAVPELLADGRTPSGLPVQIQILGGDAERMALSAVEACAAGASAIDLNFGCPAPIVNRHDGGASLLRHPARIREIVAAVRAAVPEPVAVSAKLRLGWDTTDSIDENAAMAAEGGASWLTIHARTRVQGYRPPVYWPCIGKVRADLGLPIIANGDIWSIEDFRRCRDETGCIHYMLGRGALADPTLPKRIAVELGIRTGEPPQTDWVKLFERFVELMADDSERGRSRTLCRLKQWLLLSHEHGELRCFHELKRSKTLQEFFDGLGCWQENRRFTRLGL